MLLFGLERGSLKNSPLCFSLEQILLWMSVLFSHSIAGIHARTKDMILNTCCHRSCPLFLSVRIDEVSPWLGFSPVGFMAWSARRQPACFWCCCSYRSQARTIHATWGLGCSHDLQTCTKLLWHRLFAYLGRCWGIGCFLFS